MDYHAAPAQKSHQGGPTETDPPTDRDLVRFIKRALPEVLGRIHAAAGRIGFHAHPERKKDF